MSHDSLAALLALVGIVIVVVLFVRTLPKIDMAVGFVAMTAGMLWYTQIPVHGSYWGDLLPGYLMNRGTIVLGEGAAAEAVGAGNAGRTAFCGKAGCSCAGACPTTWCRPGLWYWMRCR